MRAFMDAEPLKVLGLDCEAVKISNATLGHYRAILSAGDRNRHYGDGQSSGHRGPGIVGLH